MFKSLTLEYHCWSFSLIPLLRVKIIFLKIGHRAPVSGFQHAHPNSSSNAITAHSSSYGIHTIFIHFLKCRVGKHFIMSQGVNSGGGASHTASVSMTSLSNYSPRVVLDMPLNQHGCGPNKTLFASQICECGPQFAYLSYISSVQVKLFPESLP